MGVQTMGSHVHGLGQQLQLMPLARQSSWLSLTLDEVENHLGKSLGSMNIDELLKNVWITEANQELGGDSGDTSSASALQRQASFLLARAFSAKTVDEVWKDIQLGQKMKNIKELSQEREPTLGETTLEDFLAKAGLFVGDSSLGPVTGLDNNALTPHNFAGLSPSPSIDAPSDSTISGRKRDASDIDKTLDRRLRRKIKNRESAARSRARKQAYHNELVGKVSCLQEENTKLNKEKDFDETVPPQKMPYEPRYQLRRTTSF